MPPEIGIDVLADEATRLLDQTEGGDADVARFVDTVEASWPRN